MDMLTQGSNPGLSVHTCMASTHSHALPCYITAQHSTAQHSTAQHSTAQHSTAQHSTAQHSTAQHNGMTMRQCYSEHAMSCNIPLCLSRECHSDGAHDVGGSAGCCIEALSQPVELVCQGACRFATSHFPVVPSGTSPVAFVLAYSSISILHLEPCYVMVCCCYIMLDACSMYTMLEAFSM